MVKRDWLLAGWVLCALVGSSGLSAPSVYDVHAYGAVADGRSSCTESIQRAIDACAEAGGGEVVFRPGIYLSGTLVVRSGVILDLQAGSTLLASTDLKDYPKKIPAFRSYTDNYTEKSLIYAEKVERVGLVGHGVIDGQGASFKGPYKVRPYMMRFVQCRDVVVKDVTITNSPMWVQHYLACDDVRIDGITVRSNVNHNNDGIDIDSCHRVVVTGCNINSGDDAIVLKSTSARPCEDVVVTGCILRSACNALKMGTESNGGFKNIVLSDCVVYNTRLAGVALEIVDGGTMDGIVVSDMTMSGVGAPIFVRLGNRARSFKADMDKPGVGTLRNVTISNIEGHGGGPTGCALSGLPEAKIENVTISHVRLSFAGGGSREEGGRAVPEKADSYPEFSMFGKLPAYGLYCRHIRGLKLRDVELLTEKDDLRHAVAFEDVQDAVIDSLEAVYSSGGAALFRMNDVRAVSVRGCRPAARGGVFLRLDGAASGEVTLAGNDLSGVSKSTELGPDVRQGAVAEIGNRLD